MLLFMYIDPGTGSMLFTILIGVLSAGYYFLRNLLMKMKFVFSGGKVKEQDESHIPYAIFTDSKRYLTIFKPICDEMEKRGEKLVYLTAEEDDPLLKENYENVRTEFLGEGNRAYARMNMLKADVVLSTTPGLDVYQWKRSRDVKWYAHVLHAAGDVTMYRMFGIDYYDAMLLSGEFQIKQVRDLEALRGLPEKEAKLVGIPHMDALRERLLQAGSAPDHETTILLAPSWGPSSILNKYGKKMIDELIATGYKVIIRPHPQTFVSEKDMIEPLMKAYPETDKLVWDRNIDNFDTLNQSDILISDFSGVVLDYALVFDRPVICAETSFDNGIYDSWWLGEREWIFETLDKIGVKLTPDNMDNIKELVEKALTDTKLKEGRDKARAESWANMGKSVGSIVDYMIEKRKELNENVG
ncbi:CDP-glycerol glycerophosphotransferase family protein [Butyrivibrio sp. AE3003]|uniref:CDP-glycerol glycerophosphotransferase family protein n=1 Tax=Butyrivibrio sp. AE3003 TaxID=1496721 RepID=UPI00047E0997|nr:CDP-glycerol glycerophosphotransferase family protein [Butyrivibrio sp. AE3003]